MASNPGFKSVAAKAATKQLKLANAQAPKSQQVKVTADFRPRGDYKTKQKRPKWKPFKQAHGMTWGKTPDLKTLAHKNKRYV